jgi:hypothetical protein
MWHEAAVPNFSTGVCFLMPLILHSFVSVFQDKCGYMKHIKDLIIPSRLDLLASGCSKKRGIYVNVVTVSTGVDVLVFIYCCP